jgi:hypothetical protein
MKLELKHLAPYLPYQLNCMAQGEDKQSFEFQGVSDVTWIDLHEIGRTVCEQYDIEDVFPILRPLSDLTKEIEVDGKKFIPIMVLELDSHTLSVNKYSNHLEIRGVESNEWSYAIDVYTEIMCKLFEWHFDVFGLIEKGLAIDINTLK